MSRATRSGRAASAALSNKKKGSLTTAESDSMAGDALASLASVQTPEEAEKLLQKVTVAEHAVRISKLGEEREREWCVLKLKAERRYGQLLGPAEPKGRGNKTSVTRGDAGNRMAVNRARKVAAVPQTKFDRYVKGPQASRAGLLREAGVTKQSTGRPRKATAQQEQEVIHAHFTEKKSLVDIAIAIFDVAPDRARGNSQVKMIIDRERGRRDAMKEYEARETNGKGKKRVAGKRLRQIALERKRNPTRLADAQYEIMKMVGILEAIDLRQYGIGDSDQDTVASVHGELAILLEWTETSLAVVVAHMDDARALEKIRHLRENTNGRTPEEIKTAKKLAAQLERKRDAKLAV